MVAPALSPCGQALAGAVCWSPEQPLSSSPSPCPRLCSLPASPTTLLLCPSFHQITKNTILHAYKYCFSRLKLWQQVSFHSSGHQTVAKSCNKSPFLAAHSLAARARSPLALPVPRLAPFQRTPGYGGEQDAASESSPSLGKSLPGSSPAVCLPRLGDQTMPLARCLPTALRPGSAADTEPTWALLGGRSGWGGDPPTRGLGRGDGVRGNWPQCAAGAR